MTAATEKHRIQWWGVIPGAARNGAEPAPDEKAEGTIVHGLDFRVPRNRFMRGRDWGWDATCSCGWDSRIGAGTEAAVRRAIAAHKFDVGERAHPWTDIRLPRERAEVGS